MEDLCCPQCVPNCRREGAGTLHGACFRYTELFAQGRSPAICPRHDGGFNICYVEDEAREASVLPHCVL